MTKEEYTQAVKKARRIFASVYISPMGPHQLRISKAKALALAQTVAAGVPISAEWLDDEQQFLAIG